MRNLVGSSLLASGALSLTACGGGGGGTNFIPAPQVAPTPTPTPTPTTTLPIPPAHLGLVSAAPFAVLSVGSSYTTDSNGNGPRPTSGPTAQNVQFSYNATSNTYQIALPGFDAGTLTNPGYNGSAGQPATSSVSHVQSATSGTDQPAFVSLFVPGSQYSPYTYTSFGMWNGQTGTTADGKLIKEGGDFAYGIPTTAAEVPISGAATYSADIHGSDGVGNMANYVSGTATLSFDFGQGTLTGSMHPGVFDYFDGIIKDFGTYQFTQTVYAKGSTTFSGKFIVPGVPNANSFFEGQFTGPGAAELMSRFAAPYNFNGEQGTISGVWIGKKN